MPKTDQVPLAAALARLTAGFHEVPIAARLVRQGGQWWLIDQSDHAPIADPGDGFGAGDIVAARLVRSQPDATSAEGRPSFTLLDARLLAKRQAPPPEADRGLLARLPLLERRAAIVRAVREFFRERGFLEVETPARVVCPGLEPHLVPFPAGGDRWLITSPELHLKRLLAAGAERIFELARVWRGDEGGCWHLREFTMLEWYRAYAGLTDLVGDVIELLRAAARAAGVDPADVRGCDLTLDVERITVRDAFRRYAGIDLAELSGRDQLARAAEALDLHPAPDDGWDDLYFRILLDRVEPHLGRGHVTILERHPASQAALARICEDPVWPTAERFEAYVAGIELANAFDELTDPAEQRRRHEADREHRRRHGRDVPDLDENFLSALAAGAPPSAGIALGVDRLIALVLGLDDVRDTIPFPGTSA